MNYLDPEYRNFSPKPDAVWQHSKLFPMAQIVAEKQPLRNGKAEMIESYKTPTNKPNIYIKKSNAPGTNLGSFSKSLLVFLRKKPSTLHDIIAAFGEGNRQRVKHSIQSMRIRSFISMEGSRPAIYSANLL